MIESLPIGFKSIQNTSEVEQLERGRVYWKRLPEMDQMWQCGKCNSYANHKDRQLCDAELSLRNNLRICRICSTAMPAAIYKAHLARFHRRAKIPAATTCAVCGAFFNSVYALERHVNKMHSLRAASASNKKEAVPTTIKDGSRKFYCEICERNYASRYVLNRHNNTIHK
jgi:uncharacterized C2H2 Zn-finger protein